MNESLCSKLLKELLYSKFLPNFNYEIINILLKDIKDKCLVQIQKLLEKTPQELNQLKFSSRLLTLHTQMNRFKRCILIYLNHRLQKIENILWEFGSNFPKEYLLSLTNEEVQYMNSYKEIIREYQQSLEMDNFDLMKDIVPPHDIYVTVRGLKDYGEILTISGEKIQIVKDSIQYVKRADVEFLIVQGYLQIVAN